MSDSLRTILTGPTTFLRATLRWTALMLVGTGLLGTMGCGTTSPATQIGLHQEIPQQANRILLYQEEVPPKDVYIDAVEYFQRHDWMLTASEETMDPDELEELLDQEPLAFTAEKQVNDDLALEISAEVDAHRAGGRLVASADYSSTVTTPETDWKQAEWTEGISQEAFFEALETLRHTAYDAVEFEYGVAVEKEGSPEARQQEAQA